MNLKNRIIQNFKILFTINDNFRKDLESSRQYLVKNKLTGTLKKHKSGYFSSDFSPEPEEELKKEVIEIKSKYGLSSAYSHVIDMYLKTGIIPDYFIGLSGLDPIVVNNPKNKKEKIVVLPLTPEVTISEIQQSWSWIKIIRDNHYKIITNKKTQKISPRKNIDRDIEIYNLKKRGLKSMQIKEEINNKYPDSPVSYQEISKIIKRLKDLAIEITGGK